MAGRIVTETVTNTIHKKDRDGNNVIDRVETIDVTREWDLRERVEDLEKRVFLGIP